MADTVRIEIAVEATDKTGKVIDNIVNSLGQLKTAAGNSQDSLGKASDTVSAFDKQAGKTQKTLQSWLKQKWQIALEAKDKITPVLSTVKGVLSSLAGKAWSVTMKAVDLVTSPVKGILNLLKNPVFQVGSILGVTIGLKDTIDTYKDFEAAMSQVQAVSGASASELERLTDKAKEMGATTKFTAKEAADAFNYMAMAGWKTGDMMNGIEGIMNLAAASGEDLATTSDIVTDALTAFGLKAADSGHFADVLAAASSNANTNVGLMGESFKYAASIAGAMGVSIEDVAESLGLMANSGIKGSMAGTALRSILTRLSTNAGATKNSLGALDILTQKLGVSFYDDTGKVRDLSTVLSEAREAWKGLSAEQETSYAKTIAGQYALSGWLSLMNSAPEDIAKLSEAVNNADGAAERMKEIMLDNLQGSITLLQSAADGVKLSFGERLAPYVRQIADGLTGAMPAIERGISDFMDWFDSRIDAIKEHYREAVNTDGFEDMDFFGKVHILWDKIIADPFREWWNGTGKQMFADIAQDAGAGIGTAIRTGILALLGIDVSDTLDEGISIGKSFAEGFASGFDTETVGAAFKKAIGGLFSNVGKLFPGGEAPGLDTALSAFLLYKMASPALAVGQGAMTIGKSFFAPSASGGTSLAASLIGSSAAGTGLLGLGSNAAISLGAGNLAGGASLSTGALSALGLGAIAGGVVGGGTLLSGLADWVKAGHPNTNATEEERALMQTTGNWKVGGVAAGAAAGAAIGTIIPVVGTAAGALIGAGVGGVAGMLGASHSKKEYEEQARAAQEAADMEAAAHEIISSKAAYTGQSIETVTFKSKELTESFRDSEVSAERFGMMFREAVNEKTVSSFGDITLSLQEIRDMATSIVFDNAISGVEKFGNAMDTANRTFSDVQDDLASLEKLNWKASLGIDFSSDDISQYRSQVDGFVRDAKSYLSEKHYEGTVALKLLTNGEADTSGLDAVYGSLKEELAAKNAELQEKVQAALEDGVISTEPVTLPDGTIQLSEYEEITNLQNQISDIMNRVSQAEESAKLETLQIKYGGANLDAASFRQLQSELAENMESMTATYTDALTVSLTNLHLQFPDGGEAFEEAKAQLEAQFRQRMSEMHLRIEKFQLDTVADAFSADFDSVWPELAGSVEEMSARLREAMESALAIEPKPAQWTQEQISQWFGLDGMGAEAQTAIGEMLRSVAETLPNITDILDTVSDVDMSGAMDSMTSGAAEAVASADASPITEALESKVEEGATAADYSGVSELVNSPLMEAVNEGLDNLDGAEVEFTALEEAVENGLIDTLSDVDVQPGADALNETLGNIDVSEGGAALAENAGGAVTEAMENLDMSGATEALTTIVGGGFTEAANAVDFSEGTGILTANVTANVTDGMNGLDFSAASEAIRAILSVAIAAGISGTDLSAAFAALANLRAQVETQAQSTLGAQMTVQVPVNLTYNYSVTNPTPPKPTITTQSVTASAGARANGGFTNGAELSWIGEDGPEAIIPLGVKRRGRGLELYKQVGEILGVAKNANGGVYGNSVLYGGSTHETSVYSGSVYGGPVYRKSVYNNSMRGNSVAGDSVTNDGATAYASTDNSVSVNASNIRNGGYQATDNVFYNAGMRSSRTANISAAYHARNALTSAASTVNSSVYGKTEYIGGGLYESRNAVNNGYSAENKIDAANRAIHNDGSRIRHGDSYRTAYNSFPAISNIYSVGTQTGQERGVSEISTAYNVRDNSTASYRSVNNTAFGGSGAVYAGTEYRSGDSYRTAYSPTGAPESYHSDFSNALSFYGDSQVRNSDSYRTAYNSFPAISNIYSVGTQNDRNSVAGDSVAYYTRNAPATNIRESTGGVIAALSPLSMYNSHQSVSTVYGASAGTRTETNYDIRNSRVSPFNFAGDSFSRMETAYDTRESPLSVFNSAVFGGASQNFLNNPASVYNSRFMKSASVETGRTGNVNAYGADSLFRFPDAATAYEARKAPETASDSIWNIDAGMTREEPERLETAFRPAFEQRTSDGTQSSGTSGATIAGTPVTINVSMEPQFNIEGGGGKSEEEIVSIIRRHMREMTDEIGGGLAEQLIPVFQNMPMWG